MLPLDRGDRPDTPPFCTLESDFNSVGSDIGHGDTIEVIRGHNLPFLRALRQDHGLNKEAHFHLTRFTAAAAAD